MSCKHPSLYQSMCVVCGMKVQTAPPSSGAAQTGANTNSWKLALNVSGGKVLQLSAEEAASVTASKVSNLKNSKKLALVLDLDHTLLHAVQIEGQTPSRLSSTARVIEGTAGVGSGDGLEDNLVHHLPIEEIDRLTVKHLVMKKRPFLDEFLEKASEFCQMTVYTAGTRRYAEAVAKVLDPNRRYFADRIVSRCDVANIRADGNDKSLERIYPGDASMAVIMDDREDVWRGAQGQQLLVVKPFVHFDPRPSEAAAAAAGPSQQPGDNASTPLPDALGTVTRGATATNGGNGNAAVMSPVITLCASAAGEPAGRIAKVAPLYSFEHSCLDDQLRRCLQVLLEIHAEFYNCSNNNNNNTSATAAAADTASVESKSESTATATTAATTTSSSSTTTIAPTAPTIAAAKPRPGMLALQVPPSSAAVGASVANILGGIKKKVLAGCTLTFSGLIPTNEENPRNHTLWRLAEALGAQVSLDLLPRTTHLISVHTQTLKVSAVLQKRASEVWVLHPDWLIYCRWSLSRACEATFMLNQLAPGQALPSPAMDFTALPASAMPPPLPTKNGSEPSRNAKRGRDDAESSDKTNAQSAAQPTNGVDTVKAPKAEADILSALKRLKAAGPTPAAPTSADLSFIRSANFPPIPVPIITEGANGSSHERSNGFNGADRTSAAASSSRSSSARSQLFAQQAASSAALSMNSDRMPAATTDAPPAAVGVIKKKSTGAYLEDSPQSKHKSYIVPYDAGDAGNDYFPPEPASEAAATGVAAAGADRGYQIFNDNDALEEEAEEGEVWEAVRPRVFISEHKTEKDDDGEDAHSLSDRGGDLQEGYYLGSEGEEEEGEGDMSDEGLLCCNDDQGSTCSATSSSYLLDYEDSDDRGHDKWNSSSSGSRAGRAVSAARRSDSNSSINNHSSSDDDGSDFEVMMNRRRLQNAAQNSHRGDTIDLTGASEDEGDEEDSDDQESVHSD